MPQGRKMNKFARETVCALLLPDRRTRIRVGLLMLAVGVCFFFLGTRSYAALLVPQPPFDKLAHMIVFGGFAASAWIMAGARGLLLPVILACALGALDESLQAFTPGRDADLMDLVADLVGAVLAAHLMRFAQSALLRRPAWFIGNPASA